MRTSRKTLTLSICGAMLSILAACDRSSPTAPREGHLSASLRVAPASVASGESVVLTFTVVNDGRSPLDLVFGDSCMAEISVASGGAVVWSSLNDILCAQSVTTRTLGPGQSLEFREIWHQSKNGGGTVSPGTYRAFGRLRGGTQPTSPDVMLTIR
jgi:hypothetical protein